MYLQKLHRFFKIYIPDNGPKSEKYAREPIIKGKFINQFPLENIRSTRR